jgi:hypothetical protein
MDKIYVLTDNLSFEIYHEDLEEMTWFESRDYSINLGNRWRLPNKLELDEMYKLHLKAVGNFKFETYWSSEGSGNAYAFAKSFNTGQYSTGVSKSSSIPKYFTRLIRNI